MCNSKMRGKMQRQNNKNKNTELEKTKELNTNTQASSFQNKKYIYLNYDLTLLSKYFKNGGRR